MTAIQNFTNMPINSTLCQSTLPFSRPMRQSTLQQNNLNMNHA